MIPLMSEALLLFASDDLWSRQLNRSQKYFIHGFLMTLGTVLVTAGCIDTFYYITEDYHLYTVHGITGIAGFSVYLVIFFIFLGLVAMILMILSIILGFMASYTSEFKKLGRPVTLKFNHNFVGLLGFVIGIISLCCSYYTNWFCYYTTSEARLCTLIVTILGSLWAINVALISGYNQIKTLIK